MKAKTFESLIRKVVREEIDYALRREIKTLKEDLRSEIRPSIIEQSEIPKKVNTSLREKIMGNTPLKPRPTQNFTSNGALNDLLNETAQGSTNTESGNSSVSMAQPFASGAPLPTDITGISAPVAKAITRDYSELMGSILKNKK